MSAHPQLLEALEAEQKLADARLGWQAALTALAEGAQATFDAFERDFMPTLAQVREMAAAGCRKAREAAAPYARCKAHDPGFRREGAWIFSGRLFRANATEKACLEVVWRFRDDRGEDYSDIVIPIAFLTDEGVATMRDTAERLRACLQPAGVAATGSERATNRPRESAT